MFLNWWKDNMEIWAKKEHGNMYNLCKVCRNEDKMNENPAEKSSICWALSALLNREPKKKKKDQKTQEGVRKRSAFRRTTTKNMTNIRPGSSAGEWGWGRTRWRPAAGLWCCGVCCAPCWTKATPFCDDCAALERCSPAGHPETSAAHFAKLRIAAAPQPVSLWRSKKRKKY